MIMLMMMMMMMTTLMKLVNSATKFCHGIDKFYQPNSGLRGSKTWDGAIYFLQHVFPSLLGFKSLLFDIPSAFPCSGRPWTKTRQHISWAPWISVLHIGMGDFVCFRVVEDVHR